MYQLFANIILFYLKLINAVKNTCPMQHDLFILFIQKNHCCHMYFRPAAAEPDKFINLHGLFQSAKGYKA